ncbi:MAG: VCBS repeat-containing protein [Chitinophagaceae bacterium]
MKIPLFLILLPGLLSGCKEGNNGKFVKLSADKTNIKFTNTISESDSINIFDFSNIYNGGGIGVGDFNSDGLQDLYFTGNMVSNKLYLNKGGLQFEDITATSQTDGKGNWSRGVAVVDINNDGKMDMYVCATAKRNPMERINILYVNQGLDKNNIPVFKDMAQEYGLADTTQSTMAYFFDYDNDGDLDLFIGVNHIIVDEYANVFRKRNLNGEHPSTGRLYRNDWSESLKHPVYTDVSRQAGILIEGYTHAADIADFNDDGWMDILVLNDYISSNVLYINNRDGTFTDRVNEYFKHGAANSMGSDAVDINNDGLADVIEVDMAPQDNYRKKMFQSPISYQTYQNTEQFGYQYQYPRNMLQVNLGHTIGQQDTISHPVFAEAGFLAGIAETDWSWTPLVADFDNDGNKDIMFTNGFPKDITDRDFMTYRNQAYQLTTKQEMLEEIPAVKIHNYIYKNEGGLKFTDKTTDWGFEEPSFSNGAVYADLDNDGDLDIVINHINDPSAVYENKINGSAENKPHFLSVKFAGTPGNKDGIGAKIKVYQKDITQTVDNNPYRGYLSSEPIGLHVGLGANTVVDSVVVLWPNQMKQTITGVGIDKTLTVDIKNAVRTNTGLPILATDNWFTNITNLSGINYVHQQRDFVDFNIQKLLPHKLSEYTPGIAAGDINGDGFDDFITGGVSGYSPMIFTQNANGRFSASPMLSPEKALQKASEDRGLLLFDADNDNDLDLYIAAGGYQYDSGTKAYIDALYLNNGKGVFTADSSALPFNVTSKFCVRASDYDKDGDLDLFIAGRVDPHAYPKPVSSFIYRNDTKSGSLHFTDVTKEVAPALINIGLSCDAVFSDYDNDGWPDLVIAGEWMPITFLHNEKGKFVNAGNNSGVNDKSGWWNSLAPGDFDNDGDIDYIAGNLGLNSFYRASETRPVGIYAKDFDGNGSYDGLPSLYLPDNLEKGAGWHEFPANGRDDMVKQILGTRKDFQNYKSYAMATMDKVLPEERRKDAVHLSANYMSSAYIQNDGNGHFTITALPTNAQMSLLNGIVPDDFDGDGNLDVALITNDFGTDPAMGRYDALNGLVLKGNGKGGFTPLSILQSGLFLNGNGKGLTKMKGADGTYLLVATQNRGPIQVFKNKKPVKIVRALPQDMFAQLTFTDGRKQRVEFNYGASFLSQNGRFLSLPANVSECTITDINGKKRDGLGQ